MSDHMACIDSLLNERGKTHGDFSTHAIAAQKLKDEMRQYKNWETMGYFQREALEMIAHKIGRILAGDPNHIDHWDDCAGYATLVSMRLRMVSVPSKQRSEP